VSLGLLLSESFLLFAETMSTFFLAFKKLGRKEGIGKKFVLFLVLYLALIVGGPFLYALAPYAQRGYFLVLPFLFSCLFLVCSLSSFFLLGTHYGIFYETIFSFTVFLANAIAKTVFLAFLSSFPDISLYFRVLIEAFCFLLLGFFTYIFFFSRYQEEIQECHRKDLLFFSLFFLLFASSMDAISFFQSTNSASYYLIISLLETLYGILMAAVYYSYLSQGESEAEIAVIKHSWEEDRKQYQMQRENVDMINVKIHDLKHAISDLRNEGTLTDGMLTRLEESADIYQSVVQTGNEVLDVILSSCSLRCQKAKIQLTCMADGKELSFMDSVDLYSLFGNLLDNAFEYESSIPDPAKRFISLTVRRKGGILSIHEENHYEGNQTLSPMLKTTKKDKESHGFGTKSMRSIAEKYKGTITFLIADHMFQVDCQIPVLEKEKKQ